MRRAPPHSRLAPTLLLGLAALAAAPPASAQSQGLVVRDGTLGSAPAGVVAPGPDDLGTANYLIRADLGEQHGRNLFHSFSRFSIGSGERATFTDQGALNPGAIENVISRVTGGEHSQIDGTLHSTIPGADVWLLNPSGIVFGAGAEIDVKGSFHGGTGDYVGFQGGLERFYGDPSLPSVLSLSPPTAFGFLPASHAAAIAVDRSTLAVPEGETLELVGGDVSIALNAALRAPGGDVALEAQGQVSISQSLVDVNRTGETPGTISIRGGKVVVEKSSLVRAENESGVAAADAAHPGPGSISVDASESVLVDASLLSVSTHGAGKAGTIDVASPEITLRQGLGFDPLVAPQENRAGARAETTSSGAAGEIQLHAEDRVTLANGVGVSASAVGLGSGDAGSVAIAAREVKVGRDSHVSAETAGAGDAGTISIEASKSVVVDDSLLSVSTHGAGNAGTIRVVAPEVTFQNGPGTWEFWPPEAVQVPFEIAVGASAETTAAGKGGTLRIDASSLKVVDGAVLGAGSIGAAASGDAGAVDVSAASVDVASGSVIDVSSGWSRGDAGRVSLDVDTLTLDGAGGRHTGIDAVATSVGSGPLPTAPGTVEITASGRVEFRNDGQIRNWCGFCTTHLADRAPDDNLVAIQAGSMVAESGGGVSVGSALGGGDAGRIEVSVLGELKLQDRGELFASAFDGGHSAGSVSVRAHSVSVDGGWILAANEGGGDPSTIKIEILGAGEIRIGGSIDAGTNGEGNAGTIEILDAGSLVIESGTIAAGTSGAGNAGSITLDADSVRIASGYVVAETSGAGNAGTINILDADSLLIGSGGVINAATTAAGNAGTIEIEAGFIDLRGGGRLAASTSGEGHGGTIQIIESGSLVIGSSGFINAGTSGAGNAGDVTVRADSVRIEGESAFINVGSSGAASPGSVVGNAGTIDVVATDSILLTNEGGQGHTLEERLFGTPLPFFTGIFSATVQGGEGGSIRLKAPEITVTDGAVVSTATVSGGNGGTIDLLGDRILVAKGGYVDSTSLPDPRLEPGAARDSGDAGIVTLDATDWIEVSGHSDEFGVCRVSSSSLGSGAAGAVTLHAPRIAIDAGAVLTTAVPSDEPRERTRGGAIRLDAGRELLVTNGGRVDASTFIAGPGGSIEATAGQSIRVEGQGSGIASRTGGAGLGGTVALRAPQIEVGRGGEVSAESAPGFGPPDGPLAELFDPMGPFQGLIGALIEDPKDVTGDAGSIALAASHLVHLDDGDITTSVGVANGGDIAIDPVFVILEHGSRITSEAAGLTGQGGHIQITADNFLPFPGSVVSAQGRTPELSGTVEIHSPDVNLAGTLTPLPSTFLDAASLMRERCSARRHGERSGSFSVRGPGGIPSEPDGWLRAPVVLPDPAATATVTPGPLALVASLPGLPLSPGACP